MEIILILLIAYVLGSIPSALWVGKLFYKMDIREHGSGNLGGTNTFAFLGKKLVYCNNPRYFKRDCSDVVATSSNLREYEHPPAYSWLSRSRRSYVSSLCPI